MGTLRLANLQKKELGPKRPPRTSPTSSNAWNPFPYIFSKLFMLQKSPQLRWSPEIHDFCRTKLQILTPHHLRSWIAIHPRVREILQVPKLHHDSSPAHGDARTLFSRVSARFYLWSEVLVGTRPPLKGIGPPHRSEVTGFQPK